MMGRTTCAILAFALLTACAPGPLEEPVLSAPEPIIAPDTMGRAAPSARKVDPVAECATGNDGIGGTGCPQID